ncbi:MAG: CDC27 family protein [Treponema sp.]|nr:CDC27 family protein [Treponema sp.]
MLPVRPLILFCLILLLPLGLFSQNLYLSDDYLQEIFEFFDTPPRGDQAMAEAYAAWAQERINQGRWDEALAGLERAADFSDVSSDLSYLLALARSQDLQERGRVLEALDLALGLNRWNQYNPEAARLLKAEYLIALKAYPEALAELALLPPRVEGAELLLRALLPYRPQEFRRAMTETLDRYPRDGGPVRIFFSYLYRQGALDRSPDPWERETLDLILRRLPVLLLANPDLAWMAAPYHWDEAEAQRLVSAYRANEAYPALASLPAALNLGLIDEERALSELFSLSQLDIAILDDIWRLLRHDEARSLFRRNLSAYTGVITEDEDKDGIPEVYAHYQNGFLILCSLDASQDRRADLKVFFDAGLPQRVEVLMPGPPGAPGSGTAVVHWERYPAVLHTDLEGVRFIPRPLDFHFSPFVFEEPWAAGLLFPRRDHLSPALSYRALVFSSLRIERPSLEFPGAHELIDLDGGIPIRAREYLGDLMVADTEFHLGRPQVQRVDLTFGGTMDTLRYFRGSDEPEETENLWDYDRTYSYTESGRDY